MTGVPAIPGSEQMPLDVSFLNFLFIPHTFHKPLSHTQALIKIHQNISNHVIGISRVLYDLTPKPPGTTEWEWAEAELFYYSYNYYLFNI